MSLDLSRLRVQALSQRKSLNRVGDILVDPDSPPATNQSIRGDLLVEIAERIRVAREKHASVILMYGAHLLRNGAARIVARLMENGFITHLATNGAGTIHDWEYAWFGQSTEGVEENVAAGTFGTWDETGRYIHLALMSGALHGLGYGRALGRFIQEDGTHLPDPEQLVELIRQFPADPMAAAAADLLAAMERHAIPPGPLSLPHQWKEASMIGEAWRCKVPVTVHPGIGYDIISCHPMFNGAVIGRAAGEDFREFASAVDQLDDGVVLSVGSAIMAPQVFEKTLSCVHNLRYQQGRKAIQNHSIYVVDLQPDGGWDWTKGEPPKSNPAYYLRFCKSFSRMGGLMRYLQCDNLAFIHHLSAQLGCSPLK